MDSVKYIGMDVHKETISIAVRNSSGKLVTRSKWKRKPTRSRATQTQSCSSRQSLHASGKAILWQFESTKFQLAFRLTRLQEAATGKAFG